MTYALLEATNGNEQVTRMKTPRGGMFYNRTPMTESPMLVDPKPTS